MKEQEAKLFMNRPRIINNKIYRLKQKKYALESCLLPSGIDYSKDKVQSSPSDTLPGFVGEILEIEKEIRTLTYQKEKAFEDIMQMLDKLSGQDSDDERTVLYGYYVGMKSIESISEEINLTVRTTYRRFHEGLNNIAKML